MALETPEQQEQKPVGLYKNWQLNRIEKLCVKLSRPFNRVNYESKSRTNLQKIIHKLNKEVLLI